MKTVRVAHIAVSQADEEERLKAYLPENYRLVGWTPDGRGIVAGHDVAGWTLDAYVLPRLASGLMFGKEVEIE